MHLKSLDVKAGKHLHDLLIALAFIGMVIAPAIIATNSRVDIGDDSE
jgi:hypothetical protein